MKVKVNQRLKRLISGLAAAATVTTMLPQMPAFAETGATTVPYVILVLSPVEDKNKLLGI